MEQRYGKFAETLLEAYPVQGDLVPKTARDLARDAAFGWHTWSWAHLQSRTGNSKVYYYYFDQHPDYPEDSPRYGYGSPHGQDVAYVFMHLDRPILKPLNLTWRFPKPWAPTGPTLPNPAIPTGKGFPLWPAFSEANPEVMYFGPDPHVGPVPAAASLEVLDAYFEWRRSPEGNEWAQ